MFIASKMYGFMAVLLLWSVFPLWVPIAIIATVIGVAVFIGQRAIKNERNEC